ncbi:hypothetical protein [Kitasatospora sp. NPDC058046]|uniref:hypothetical protein n=1 Tax=Kitasatospora sp. NPDC058046 TaxID=3346312 RepID=UPI0036DE1469
MTAYGQGCGGCVARKTRPRSLVLGVGRPVYITTRTPTPPPPTTGPIPPPSVPSTKGTVTINGETYGPSAW